VYALAVPVLPRLRFLAALGLVAALLRMGLLACLPRVVHGDEAAYLLIGRSIWQGAGSSHTHPPLLPVLAGAVWRLTGNPELGTGLWFVLFGALTVVSVYLLAHALCGRRAALMAGGLVAVYPALSTAIPFWSSMTEPLFIFLVYSGVAAAFFGSRDERPRLLAWAGALFALAYLTRPEGALWLATTAAAVVVSRRLLRQPLGRAAGKHLACLAAGFLALALPYVVWLRLDTGRWAASGKVAIAYEVGEAVLREDPQMFDRITNSLDERGQTQWLSKQRFERSLPQRILHHPGEVARRVGRNVARLFARIAKQQVFPVYFAALVLVSWLLRPRTRQRLAGDLWVLAAALPVVFSSCSRRRRTCS
jgi:4-amino-4-deoxy-L-arabinose transferase-like glycosyltransferase